VHIAPRKIKPIGNLSKDDNKKENPAADEGFSQPHFLKFKCNTTTTTDVEKLFGESSNKLS